MLHAFIPRNINLIYCESVLKTGDQQFIYNDLRCVKRFIDHLECKHLNYSQAVYIFINERDSCFPIDIISVLNQS